MPPRQAGQCALVKGALLRRAARLWVWTFTAWLLLTWTATVEQFTVGAAACVAVSLALAPLADVARPWVLLHPRRLAALASIGFRAMVRTVRANIDLARRIWSPARPLRSGMIVVPTVLEQPGEIAADGIISSLIVDHQLVDLDLRHREQLYHAIWVHTTEPTRAREYVDAWLEAALLALPGRLAAEPAARPVAAAGGER